jgi:hypothetical protein
MKSYMKQRGKKQGIVLKLDFEKAYDKVDWEYLMKYISHKGFYEEWCAKINGIIRNGTLCVKINNTRGKKFGSQGGLGKEILSPLFCLM